MKTNLIRLLREEKLKFYDLLKKSKAKKPSNSSDTSNRHFLSGKDNYSRSISFYQSGFNGNRLNKNKKSNPNVAVIKVCRGISDYAELETLLSYIYKQENIVKDELGREYFDFDEIERLIKNKDMLYKTIAQSDYYNGVFSQGNNTRQYNKHIIFSYPCTSEKDLETALKDTIKRTFGEECSFLYAIHKDTANLHAHVLLDSINYINNDFSSFHDLAKRNDPDCNPYLKLQKNFIKSLKNLNYNAVNNLHSKLINELNLDFIKSIQDINSFKEVLNLDKKEDKQYFKNKIKDKVLVVDFGECVDQYHIKGATYRKNSYYITYYKNNKLHRIVNQNLKDLIENNDLFIGDYIQLKYDKVNKCYSVIGDVEYSNINPLKVKEQLISYDLVETKNNLVSALNDRNSVKFAYNYKDYKEVYNQLYFNCKYHYRDYDSTSLNDDLVYGIDLNGNKRKSIMEDRCVFIVFAKTGILLKKETAVNLMSVAKAIQKADNLDNGSYTDIGESIVKTLKITTDPKLNIRDFNSYIKAIAKKTSKLNDIELRKFKVTTNRIINNIDKNKYTILKNKRDNNLEL